MKGIESARKIRELDKSIKICIATASADAKSILKNDDIKALNIDKICQKPFELIDLKNLINL